MNLSDFIIKISEKVIKTQNDDGSFPPGHNGPYHDTETQVRNSSHWLVTFAKCYDISKDIKYKETIQKTANYLFSKNARPFGSSFYHRRKIFKDRCNGLIGQAWTFEALAEASRILNNGEYAALAQEVFLQHHFCEDYGLWHRLEINGKILPIDPTFNHQLWFAACSSLLIKPDHNNKTTERIVKFMDTLTDNLTLFDSGLIHHSIKCLDSISFYFKMRHAYNIIIQKNKTIKYKSSGYHSFNMYAFAILKHNFSDHTFWDTCLFKNTLEYQLSDEFSKNISSNKYGYSYNSPGYEMPYILHTFGNLEEEELIRQCEYWINEHIKLCYNKETGMMGRNTDDLLTLTARIYELIRLPCNLLNKIKVTA